MILDDRNADAVLRIIYHTAGGRTGLHIRTEDVAAQSSIDPAVVLAAIEQLVKARMLLTGATADRVCLTPAAIAWIRSHPLAAAG